MMDSYFKKNILGQLIALFFVQTSSTIAYAVFYSGLSIYLTQNKHYSQQTSAVITGLFLSLNYFLPLIGGFIAGRTITYKNLYYLGEILSLVGCLLLINGRFLHLSFALFLMGSLNNICLKMFITQLFTSDQINQRRIAFTWNYIGMNVGFMIGFFLAGFSTLSNSYHYLFALMAYTKVISLLITYLFIYDEKSNRLKLTFKNIAANMMVLIFLIVIIKFLFDYVEYVHSWLILASLLMLAIVMAYSFNNSDREEKKKLIQFISFSTMSILFWSAYFLTPLAIMQLIHHNGQKHISGITIAPQWYVNIDSIAILIISPILSLLIKRSSNQDGRGYLTQTSHYFSTSFFFACLAFAVLCAGLNYFTKGGKIPFLAILGYLLALAIGEIFISPASNALVGELIKEPLRGVMTGIISINLAIGGLIASMIASRFILPYINNSRISNQIDVQNDPLENTFLIISVVLFVFAIISLFVTTKRSKSYVKLTSTST